MMHGIQFIPRGRKTQDSLRSGEGLRHQHKMLCMLHTGGKLYFSFVVLLSSQRLNQKMAQNSLSRKLQNPYVFVDVFGPKKPSEGCMEPKLVESLKIRNFAHPEEGRSNLLPRKLVAGS